MKIQELKHSRTLITVLQGLLLLVILATLFSVCISLLKTGVRADLNAMNEKLAGQQTVSTEGNDQQTIDGLEELKKVTEEVEQYEGYNSGTLKLLAFIMYAAFALLFLLRALITRDNWRLNQFRYGIGSLLFAACAGIFLFTDSAIAPRLATVLHVTALIVDQVQRLFDRKARRNEFVQPVCQDLTVGACHFLTDDDLYVIELFGIFLSFEGTLDRIVIRDAENVHPVFPGTIDLCLRFGDGFGETEHFVVGDSGEIRVNVCVHLRIHTHLYTVLIIMFT